MAAGRGERRGLLRSACDEDGQPGDVSGGVENVGGEKSSHAASAQGRTMYSKLSHVTMSSHDHGDIAMDPPACGA